MAPSSTAVLIVGAGELGESILTALSSHSSRPADSKIDVLLRADSIASPPSNVKKASNGRLRALGATLIPGNFVDDNISELAAIFKGYDVVIQAGGYGLPKGTQLKVTRAVLQAGVERYFPWQFGVDYEAIGPGSAHSLFDEMLAVRQTLRAQTTTKWTVISTGLFMSYLFLPDFGVVDLDATPRKARALGSWNNEVTVTTPDDIGRLAAEMVFVPGEKGDTLDRVVYVGGETVSYEEVAGVLEEVLGGGFEREEWDIGFLRERLRLEPENLWYKYQCIFGEGKGVSWDLKETLNGRRGIKMTTVRNYVVASYATK